MWRILLGALVLLGTTKSTYVQTGSRAEALGALLGFLALVALAVWLIASGLPKSIVDDNFSRLRRQMWYKLAGQGLLVTILLAVVLVAMSQFMAAVIVSWGYCFGWTWVSWRIADKRALSECSSRLQIAALLRSPSTGEEAVSKGGVKLTPSPAARLGALDLHGR